MSVIKHEFSEGWSFQALNLYLEDASTIWVVPKASNAGFLEYHRRFLQEVPVMAFAPEHHEGIQERLDALGEMEDGKVDVHLVEIQMPEEKLYAFFAVKPGVSVELRGFHQELTG